jgi:TPR repeat protein
MLYSLLSLKLAAMVAALGLDTAEWKNPSSEMTAEVQALADLQKKAASGETPTESLQEEINKIKALADKGDKDAQFAMGLFLQQSNAQGSLPQALEYYKKAAENGQLQAMNNYGFIVAASTQDPAQAKEGVKFIKEAADKGLNAARRNMATIYIRGMAGEPQDFAKAKTLLETAVADKDYQAEFELAQFYLSPGVTQSDDKAWELLNSAAQHGNPNALAALGSVLFDGKEFGVAKKKIPADPKKAVELFKKLAEQNNPAGLRTMGELYQKGIKDTGIEKDFAKALEYYGKAAQANDAVAQVILAGFYDRGFDADTPPDGKLEVAANPAASLELYRLAAQNNVPLAFYNIGAFYEAGRAVDKDPTKAFAYFLQSAVNGFGPGMQKTGVYYLNGAGTLKDPVAATGWFSRSAGAGVPEGFISLGVMAENGLVASPDRNTTQYQMAGANYSQVEDSPAASDPVRVEALLRLGNLYFRGLMVGGGKTTPEPDYEKAYIYFRMASEIDPKNKLAEQAKEEADKKLTQDQKTKAGSSIDAMKAARKAIMERAAAPATLSPSPASTPAAAPTPPPPAPAPSKKKGK